MRLCISTPHLSLTLNEKMSLCLAIINSEGFGYAFASLSSSPLSLKQFTGVRISRMHFASSHGECHVLAASCVKE